MSILAGMLSKHTGALGRSPFCPELFLLYHASEEMEIPFLKLSEF